MYNFCTLFNSKYLAKGLALYSSLLTNCNSFHLYIFAFDDGCRDFLKAKHLEHATIIGLSEFEDPELLSIKQDRSIAEYCWTSTSSTILYCLKNFKIDSCAYLDADLYFFGSPEILFKEIGDASIAITRHNYHFMYNQTKTNGEYCVQFMYFKKDENAIAALYWWRSKCIDWCYNYLQDGKFGDQGYMDELIRTFKNIRIITNEAAGMAPWNLLRYKFQGSNLYSIRFSKVKFSLVFFHFHFLNYTINPMGIAYNPGKVFFPKAVIQNLYLPYLKELYKIEADIDRIPYSDIDRITFSIVNTSVAKKIFAIIGVLLKRSSLVRKFFIEKEN